MKTLILLFVCVVQILGKCPNDCKHRNFLYESFQCTPNCIGRMNCPISYDCSSINKQSDMCFYNGQYYKEEEFVQNNVTWENCMGCSCTKDTNNKPTFMCYYADCPRPFPIDEGCAYKQTLGQCCYRDVICPPFSKCFFKGKIFLEQNGKFLHPKDNCTMCVCERNGYGKGVTKCQKQYCSDLLFFQQDIKSMCAPFYNNVLYDCCPSQWICPNNNVTINKPPQNQIGPTCLFGNTTLKKKQTFYVDVEMGKVVCECKLPPYATCSLLTAN